MKNIFAVTLLLPFLTSVFFIMCTRVNETESTETETGATAANPAAPSEILAIRTEFRNETTHWAPDVVKVQAGKTYTLVAKHEIPNGPDFHGLTIKELKIETQVNRGTDYRAEVNIPAELKGQTLKIGCQFHPAHQAAQLIVE